MVSVSVLPEVVDLTQCVKPGTDICCSLQSGFLHFSLFYGLSHAFVL